MTAYLTVQYLFILYEKVNSALHSTLPGHTVKAQVQTARAKKLWNNQKLYSTRTICQNDKSVGLIKREQHKSSHVDYIFRSCSKSCEDKIPHSCPCEQLDNKFYLKGQTLMPPSSGKASPLPPQYIKLV